MAEHIRRGFLTDIKTQLKPLTQNGSVWITRSLPPSAARPCFTLFDDSETSEITTIHGGNRPQRRDLSIVVIGWTVYDVNDPEKSEQRMDAAALAIEQTLVKPTGADDCYLISTEKNLDEDDPKSSSVSLRYQIIYRSTERSPV